MDEREKAAEDEEFWRFSLAFYDRPGIAEALIALQDRDGCDVNVMLFALWLGMSGRGPLGDELLAAAEHETATLQSEIVEPLRSIRRRLRHHSDSDVQNLREGVKALELAGEKLIQTRLARLAGPGPGRTDAEGCRATARANLARYLGPKRIRHREAGIIGEAFDAFAREL